MIERVKTKEKGERKMKKNNSARKKPVCKLKNRNLTIWDAIQEVIVTLKNAGLKDKAERFWKETCKYKTHDEIVAVVSKYVEIK
jgi:hypothetical protein